MPLFELTLEKFLFSKKRGKRTMILTQRILLSITIFTCLIATSGISAAQGASSSVQVSDLEHQIEKINAILDEIEVELNRSDLSPDDVNKRIDQALNLLTNVGESNKTFRSTIESAIPSGRKIVNNLMRSENKEKENQRLVAAGQVAALMLILTLAHLEDIDRSFTEVDSSFQKVEANAEAIKKCEERLKSLEEQPMQIDIFNNPIEIKQIFQYGFPLTLAAVFPIYGDPLWLWFIKKLWWCIKKLRNIVKRRDRNSGHR